MFYGAGTKGRHEDEDGGGICYRGGRTQQGGEAEEYSSAFQRKGPEVRAAEVLLKPILRL